MAEDGQLAQFSARSGPTEPTLSDLLDPHALEERLKEARSRRAEALARKAAAAPDGDVQTVVQSPRLVAPRPLPVPESPAPRPAAVIAPPVIAPPAVVQPEIEHAVAPAAEPAARRQAGAYFALIFLAGLGLGGAAVAVLALRSLPDRIAAVQEPAPAPVVVAPAATPDPAPAPAARRRGRRRRARRPCPPPCRPRPRRPRRRRPPPPAPRPAPSRRRPPWRCASTAPRRWPPRPSPPPRPLPPAGPVAALPAPPAPPRRRRRAGSGPRHRRRGADAAARRPPCRRLPAPTLPTSVTPPALAPSLATLPPRVIIHYPSSAESAAIGIRDALAADGNVEVETVPVRFAIGRSNIRFYHATDAAGAAALSRFVAPALPGRGPARAARLHRLRHPDRPR